MSEQFFYDHINRLNEQEVAKLKAEIKQLQDVVDKLQVALLCYGNHRPTCTYEAGAYPRPCNCGWSSIREAAEAEKETP